jgi:hypothetical protein
MISMLVLFILAGLFGISVAMMWAAVAWPDEWLQPKQPAQPQAFIIRGDQTEHLK